MTLAQTFLDRRQDHEQGLSEEITTESEQEGRRVGVASLTLQGFVGEYP